MRVGINGLGRIGRSVLRLLWQSGKHLCVQINDTNCDIHNIAYLLRHDTVCGRFPGQVTVDGSHQIILQGSERRWNIQVSHHPVISDVEWNGVECVIDSSGTEENTVATRRIINSELSHVIVTHTLASADFTLVFGVNEALFEPSRHRLISSSICDACAIAPVLRVLSDHCGFQQCFVTTLHPWLSYQQIVDGPAGTTAGTQIWNGYYALGRASVGNLIPKPTTVGRVLETLVPSLKDHLFAFSFRIPTPVVASADLSLVTSTPISADKVRSLLRSMDENLIRSSDEMLVSIDYRGETASAVVDLRWLEVRDNYVKLVLWYDNEWGYSARVVDIIDLIANKGGGR